MAAKTAKEQLGVDLEAPTNGPQAIGIPDAPVVDTTPDRPEWLPENFESPEAFAASYKEAQNRIREEAESRKRLEAQVNSLTQAIEGLQPQQQTPAGDDAALREQLMAAYENDPIGTIAYLANQTAATIVDQRLQQFQSQQEPMLRSQQEQQNQLLAVTVDRQMGDKHDDWNDYKPKVADLIQREPYLLPQEILAQGPEATTNALERVYVSLKAQDTLAAIQNGTFQSEQSKMLAQSVSGGGSRPGAPDPAEAKFAELKAAAQGMSYSAMRGGS